MEAGDPPIDWIVGDLLDPDVRHRALGGVRGVIHTASLGLARARPAAASARPSTSTRPAASLAEAAAAGVERFVYTSTLYTLAAGTEERSRGRIHAVESPARWTQPTRGPSGKPSSWCSRRIDRDSPRSPSVRGWSRARATPNRPRPQIAKAYSRTLIAIVPPGGIPIIDVELAGPGPSAGPGCGDGGEAYAVVGPYLSYGDLAARCRVARPAARAG